MLPTSVFTCEVYDILLTHMLPSSMHTHVGFTVDCWSHLFLRMWTLGDFIVFVFLAYQVRIIIYMYVWVSQSWLMPFVNCFQSLTIQRKMAENLAIAKRTEMAVSVPGFPVVIYVWNNCSVIFFLKGKGKTTECCHVYIIPSDFSMCVKILYLCCSVLHQ